MEPEGSLPYSQEPSKGDGKGEKTHRENFLQNRNLKYCNPTFLIYCCEDYLLQRSQFLLVILRTEFSQEIIRYLFQEYNSLHYSKKAPIKSSKMKAVFFYFKEILNKHQHASTE
jgi:hypothetical protein